MALHELESPEALLTFLSSNANSVICFSATWCGPCTRSKPDLIAMAESYANDYSKDVKFGIVYEHKIGKDCLFSYGVRAFPTYILFCQKGTQQRGSVQGANFAQIRSMIEQAGCKREFGEGNSLGGGGGASTSMEDARALRLQRLGAASAATATDPTTSVESKETKNSSASMPDVEMENVTDESPEKNNEETENNIDPTAHLNQDILKQLTSSMGFSLLRAQKGLLYGEGQSLEGAIEWIMNHQDDADIDDPIPTCVPASTSQKSAASDVAQSYKCNECGKILSNMANLELHANKTGHSDFEESTQAVKPLTPEEKVAKVEEIKRLLKAKRAERENTEKKDDIEREKQRRFMGKEMVKTREMMEIEKRKRDAKLRKKAKDDEKRERERLRMELAKDKAERMANKGKLSSKLGLEGYKPDGIQYDKGDDADVDTNPVGVPKAKKKSAADASKINDYIQKVSAYRAGGDGGRCLKVLLAYVGNVVDKSDDKFKTINMENKVYKAKVKPFIGAKNLLMAVGFQPSEDGTSLILKEDADRELLTSTKIKLEEAHEKY